MGKDKDRRLVLRRAAIGAAFALPIVLGACGGLGGEIPPQCKQNPIKCIPGLEDKE
jgi:hypothetical protein